MYPGSGQKNQKLNHHHLNFEQKKFQNFLKTLTNTLTLFQSDTFFSLHLIFCPIPVAVPTVEIFISSGMTKTRTSTSPQLSSLQRWAS